MDIDSRGNRSVSGKPHELKASQAYPKDFGEAIAELFDDHKQEISDRLCSLDLKGCCEAFDAQLQTVLGAPRSRMSNGPWRNVLAYK